MYHILQVYLRLIYNLHFNVDEILGAPGPVF